MYSSDVCSRLRIVSDTDLDRIILHKIKYNEFRNSANINVKNRNRKRNRTVYMIHSGSGTDATRFSLGNLSNVSRNNTVENTRRHIGRGENDIKINSNQKQIIKSY